MDPIRVLIVEDVPDDAELMVLRLSEEGFQVKEQRVDNESDYLAALTPPPDLILANWSLPDFSGLRALERLKERSLDIPFVIVSGSIGEETAVEAIHRGAYDYVLKDRLGRLGQAVRHALQEKQLRLERMRAERSLRQADENIRHSLDHSPLGVRIVTSEGETLYANRATLGMYGYDTLEELQSTPVKERYTPESFSEFRVRMEKRARGETVPSEYEISIVKKSGEVRHLQVFRKEVLWSGQKQFQTVYQDITERKRAEKEMISLQDQLRQSQKMEAIGRLAGGIAHDFNNLLTVISGNAQLCLLGPREQNPFHANLKEIQDAANKAAGLTRQLLAFSRKQVLETKVLDLNFILQGIDKMLRRVIGEDILLQVVPVEPIGKIKADPGQLEQIIMNLVVNARDAMPEGGRLVIKTENVELDQTYSHKHLGVQPGRYVMLSMTDTGMGMTPEVKERIFDPFFTTKEAGKGTGLGLSTVYGIVKQSGGHIRVYSELGLGSTFKIYLPRVDDLLEEREEEEGSDIPAGNETILLIEDEEAVRKLTSRALAMQGYRVLEALNGEDAVTLCRIYFESIHLFLTDVVMPGISGEKLVDRLKTMHPESKVLYMSGYTDHTNHRGILEKGIHFIQKPFNVGNLARKVREVLDQEQETRDPEQSTLQGEPQTGKDRPGKR